MDNNKGKIRAGQALIILLGFSKTKHALKKKFFLSKPFSAHYLIYFFEKYLLNNILT